jgi:ring-1,2-phenylacetyl-CoA epoxidase subunit PaaD
MAAARTHNHVTTATSAKTEPDRRRSAAAAERVCDTNRSAAEEQAIWDILDNVPDPEIPAVSVVDLGIVRDVSVTPQGSTISITPTYSGCPATEFIETMIRDALTRAGQRAFTVKTVISPPWTTDWITPRGRERLKRAGIAPPVESTGEKSQLLPPVPCPRCASANTRLVSEFGSTPCKAHYQCRDCLEPFDYFKCLR